MLLVPDAPKACFLAVFKLPPCSPSTNWYAYIHSSVAVVTPGEASPPNAKAFVEVPAPPPFPRAVFKLFCSVQLVPFHNSVFAVKEG